MSIGDTIMRKELSVKKISLSLVFIFASSSLFAQTNVLTTSNTSLSRSWDKLVERIDMKYRTIFGVSSGQEDENEFEGKIDYDEAPKGRMLNDLEISIDITKRMSASVVGVWSVQPRDDEMNALEPLDPYAKLSYDGIVEIDNFAVSTDLRIGAPVSLESKGQKKVATIGSEQEIEYQFGKSRFSMEMELYLQYNIHKEETGYDDFEVRYEPALLYEISDRYFGRISYESEMYHERNAALSLIDNRDPVIQTGIGLNIDKKLMVMPFVDMPVNAPSRDKLFFGVQAAWAML